MARKTVVPEVRKTNNEYIADFPIDQIQDREENTKIYAKETDTVLMESIARFGFVEPVILDVDHNVVHGQHRLNIARKLKLETVPVIVTDGVNKEDGTTDLYHMLSDRIVEWDKWYFPATDRVLTKLDGGLPTVTLLDFETTSEKGELRDIVRKIGWFIDIVPTNLSASSVTLNKLAELLTKSLAGKYQFDESQLLFIEALRDELQQTREKMVAQGITAGGVVEKLERHKNDEAAATAAGEAIAEEKDFKLEVSEDGAKAVFTAKPELEFMINEVLTLNSTAKKQLERPSDMVYKPTADGKKMGLTAFISFATTFGDMTAEDAKKFFNGKNPEDFNAYVDEIIASDPVVEYDTSKKNAPADS